MVSLKRATTSCVVQKEKTQTRITFNNLSASLTVNELYKYVQLHLEEEQPFELALVARDAAESEAAVAAGNATATTAAQKVRSARVTRLLCSGLIDSPLRVRVLLIL